MNLHEQNHLAGKNKKCNVTFNENSEAQKSTIVHTEQNIRQNSLFVLL